MDFPELLLAFPNVGATLPYPHLAIPSLAAYLAAHGYRDVGQVDLNSRFTAPARRSRLLRRLRGASAPDQADESSLLRSYRASGATDPETLWDFAMAAARSPRPKAIGFSLVYPQQVRLALALARVVRLAAPQKVLFCGGPMVTLNVAAYTQSQGFASFDALVVGDGEAPALALAEQLKLNAGAPQFAEVPNCYYRAANSFRFSGRHFVMAPKDYVVPEFEGGPFSTLPLRVSKGCYWRKCTFCTYRAIFDGYMPTDVRRAVEHVAALATRHRVHRFVLVDDSLPPKVLRRFAEALIGAGINTRWDCSTILDKGLRDPEIGRVLAASGLNTVFLGFESASERVLELMQKPHRMDIVLEILRNLKRHGICAHLNVMIGFPTEEMHEAQETIEFLRRNRDLYDNYSAQKFSLERNSEVFASPKRFGISRIDDSGDENTSDRVGFEFSTEHGMNPSQRLYMAKKAMMAYRKRGTSLLRYAIGRMDCARYWLKHRREIASAK